jgi:hypothetical protein
LLVLRDTVAACGEELHVAKNGLHTWEVILNLLQLPRSERRLDSYNGAGSSFGAIDGFDRHIIHLRKAMSNHFQAGFRVGLEVKTSTLKNCRRYLLDLRRGRVD